VVGDEVAHAGRDDRIGMAGANRLSMTNDHNKSPVMAPAV
jgi:hypothetical protein